MLFVRSLLFLLWLVVTVMPYAVVVVLVSIFVRGRPLYWLCVGWIRTALWGARWICGIRHRVHGWEHVTALHEAGQAVVLMPKHQSAWETLALPGIMPRPLCFVFKRELLWVPFFGWALGRLDMIHIDRTRRSEAWRRVAEQGRRYMDIGNWVIMFPEGTRTARGSLGEYKSGGTRLAVAADAVVLPVAITSARCWPRQAFIKRPGIIDVSFGPPIATKGRHPEALLQEVQTWIEAEMRRLDPTAYPDASSDASSPPAPPGSPMAPEPPETPGAPDATSGSVSKPVLASAVRATPATPALQVPLAGPAGGPYTERP